MKMRPKVFFDGEMTEEDAVFFDGWQATSQAAEKDVHESKRVAKRIRAVQKGCWFNARKAILKLDDYADASLIEGWANLNNGLAIEHGWIVKDGMIIDPTICERSLVYYPGLEFRGRAEIQKFDSLSISQGRREKGDPFFFAFGWGGMYSPSLRRSYDEALKRSMKLCASTSA